MKTTIEVSDSLLAEARAAAAREKTTLRALVERGLRKTLDERRKEGPFKLRRATFRGKGLRPEVGEGSWARLRDVIYEGRGA